MIVGQKQEFSERSVVKFLQISLVPGLTEDSWILTSFSIFDLLLYHVTHHRATGKLQCIFMRE